MSDLIDEATVARRRMWADRPSPALPLVLLAAVVAGGIVVNLIDDGMFWDSPGRLIYWCAATAVALAAIAFSTLR